LVAGLGYVSEIVVLVLIVMFVMMFDGVMLLAMLIMMRFGMSFVMLVLIVMLFALVGFGSATLTDRFAGQNFRSDGSGCWRRAVAVRIAVAMAVIVVFEIFEDVADVQEGVTVEADIDEGGLHTGEDASNAALVDATDQRELFFALDINFD